MEELYEILQEILPNVDIKSNNQLVDNKILTSLNLIKLVAKLNDVYDIKITPMHLVPENFNSAEAIYALIQKLM